VAVGVVAAVLYSNFLLAWALQGFGNTGTVVSRLEVAGQPDSTVLRVTDVGSTLLVLLLLPSMRDALPEGRLRSSAVVGGWAFALGALVAASVALPCGPGVSCTTAGQVARAAVHDTSSTISDVAAFVSIAATWWLTRRRGPRWAARTTWWVFWVGGVVAGAVMALAYAGSGPDWLLGAAQRVHIGCISIWIVCLGLLVARRPDTVHPPRAQEGVA
jgi:hypothetical protein